MTHTLSRQRTGPFWDSVEGRIPLPPAATTLGLELLEADGSRARSRFAFTATDAFTTPRGDVLEGFLAAMLHDTVGPPLLATLKPASSSRHTTSMPPSWRRQPGRLVGRGHVVQRDDNLAFVEAALSDADDRLVALATSTLRVVRFESRWAA